MNPENGAPPPRMVGAEWLSINVTNAAIDGNGEASIKVSDFTTNKTGSQDIIINDVGTEALTELELKDFGGGNDASDIIRLDLSTFNDDFTLILNGISPNDTLVLTGVDSVVYNADFTQTVTYTGSDGQTHVLTISDDVPFDQVAHYSTGDGAVDGSSDDEVIGDSFADYAGDEVDHSTNNTIFGNGGADTITAGAGDDTIFGDFDVPAGSPAPGVGQPSPQAEQLTFNITNAEIDNDGDVVLQVDSLALDVGGQEDIVFVDAGTEAISTLHIAKMGKGDEQQDVFRFDLSTFDDDFTITVWSEGPEDFFVFSNAQSIADNGDGTSTITYIGSDSATHTVTIDTGLAQLEFFTGPVSEEFDDSIDGGAGNDRIDGGFGADTIDGGAGDDTLIGNVGGDSIHGGSGDDLIYGDFEAAPVPLSGPDTLPWAEVLSVDIDNADIDNADGTVVIDVDVLSVEKDLSQDIVLNDTGTEAISEVVIQGLGGDAVDVIRLDLTGFNDDFDFIVENVGSEDSVVFTGVTGVTDNGDGTHTLSYIGSDNLPHNVTVDTNAAQMQVIYATVDETQFEADGDFIDGGLGADTIEAGYGDDTIAASSGDDVIHGGTGTDTYDVSAASTLPDEAVSVVVDADGDGTVDLNVDGGTATVESIERFVAQENAGNDEITFTEGVEASEVTGLDGDEAGVFIPSSGGGPISFGGPGEPTLAEILSGTYVPMGEFDPIDPDGSYSVTGDDLDFSVGNIDFENFEDVSFFVGDPVCFTKGTHILAEDGEKRVEDLVPGMRVFTWDGGYQTIRWIGKSTMLAQGDTAPVTIAKGVLGNTRPLSISQNHRLMISGYEIEMMFGAGEVFVPAKALVDGRDITIDEGGLVDYYHVFLDQHEILYSEGVLTESFFPGDMAVQTISNAAREEFFSAFPALVDDPCSYGPTARRCLKTWEARTLSELLPSLRRTFFLQKSDTTDHLSPDADHVPDRKIKIA